MSEQLSVLVPLAIRDVVGFSAAVGARTYYDSTGALQTAADGVLRMSYDPGNLQRAPLPLIEAAATNLFLWSRDFTNAAWGPFNVACSASPRIAPDGVAMTRVVPNGVNGLHYLQQGVALVSGQKYACTVAAAAAGYEWIGVEMKAGASFKYAYVRIATGEIGRLDAGLTFSKPPVLVNGVCTFSVTWDGSVAGAPTFTFFVTQSNNVTGYAGDGVSGIDFWFAQVETDKAASFIKTLGAPVTRPADVLDNKKGILYTSVPENDYPVYDPAKTYASGEFCISLVTHRIYRSEADGNLNKDPTKIDNQISSNGSTVWWFDYAPTNRWAMFDDQGNTQTIVASPLIVSLRAGGFNSSWAGGLDSEYVSIVVQDAPGGNVIFEFSSALEASAPGDWDEYFFSPFRPLTDFLNTNIDQYSLAVVTIMFTKSSGNVKCGMWTIGGEQILGRTQYGVKIKPKTYSFIDTDKFGRTNIERRGSATDMDASAQITLADAAYVGRVLRSLLDVPVVVIGAGSEQYGDLRVFGLLSGEIDYDQPEDCLLTTNTKGVI